MPKVKLTESELEILCSHLEEDAWLLEVESKAGSGANRKTADAFAKELYARAAQLRRHLPRKK